MTKYRGHKTGFNPSGDNGVTPGLTSAPKTDFCGRGAVPGGKLKRYPGSVADISGGNRRLAKSDAGDGGGSGTRFSTSAAFGRGRK